MDNNDTFVLEFSEVELDFLARLLEMPLLTNSDEATAAKMEEDLAKTDPEAIMSDLSERQMIQSDQDGNLLIDATVARLLAVQAFPESALRIDTYRENAVDGDPMWLFNSQGLLVERVERPDGRQIVTAYRNRDAVLVKVLNLLSLQEQPAAHSESFVVGAEDFAQVPYVIAGNGAEDGAAFLQEKGAPKKAASRLANALENPVRQSVIQTVRWHEGGAEEVDRATLLEEVYGLWLISPSEEDKTQLEIAPYSAEEASERVREMVYQVLPQAVE